MLWRLPPPADTTYSWLVLRAPARACEQAPPGILPDMTREEMLKSTEIYSVAGLTGKNNPIISARPFRAPHHTVSGAAMSGGGAVPRPGEISLAHNGVLFLDELPEFRKDVLEVLRQPLEDGEVTVSRVAGTETFPANFMLVCAMNPVQMRLYGHPSGAAAALQTRCARITAASPGRCSTASISSSRLRRWSTRSLKTARLRKALPI